MSCQSCQGGGQGSGIEYQIWLGGGLGCGLS